MLGILKDFLEFFYDNHSLVWDNIIIFLIWGLMCMGVGYMVGAYKSRSYKQQIDSLKQENSELIEMYGNIEDARLLAGIHESKFSSQAENVSKQFSKVKKKKWKN